MKRYQIIYCGRVQGVGFRYQVMNKANDHKLTGYVRNLSNGNVEAQVQGDDIDGFIYDTTHRMSYFVQVDEYIIKEIPLIEGERSFEIADYYY